MCPFLYLCVHSRVPTHPYLKQWSRQCSQLSVTEVQEILMKLLAPVKDQIPLLSSSIQNRLSVSETSLTGSSDGLVDSTSHSNRVIKEEVGNEQLCDRSPDVMTTSNEVSTLSLVPLPPVATPSSGDTTCNLTNLPLDINNLHLVPLPPVTSSVTSSDIVANPDTQSSLTQDILNKLTITDSNAQQLLMSLSSSLPMGISSLMDIVSPISSSLTPSQDTLPLEISSKLISSTSTTPNPVTEEKMDVDSKGKNFFRQSSEERVNNLSGHIELFSEEFGIQETAVFATTSQTPLRRQSLDSLRSRIVPQTNSKEIKVRTWEVLILDYKVYLFPFFLQPPLSVIIPVCNDLKKDDKHENSASCKPLSPRDIEIAAVVRNVSESVIKGEAIGQLLHRLLLLQHIEQVQMKILRWLDEVDKQIEGTIEYFCYNRIIMVQNLRYD